MDIPTILAIITVVIILFSKKLSPVGKAKKVATTPPLLSKQQIAALVTYLSMKNSLDSNLACYSHACSIVDSNDNGYLSHERTRINQEREDLKVFKDRHSFITEESIEVLTASYSTTTKKEYNVFLTEYLSNGGTYTNEYSDRKINDSFNSIFTVLNDSFHEAKCGASSRVVLVPEGITYYVDGTGHDTILFMKDFTKRGHFLPKYKDSLEGKLK